ncbi:hypothetical protein D3C77_343230 [compost metagenome]
MIPEIGETAPFLILVAVRAIAPVAGMPPNNGAAIFAMPCPINSRLLLCLLFVIPSATTADSKDSMLPNIAIMKAGLIIAVILLRLKSNP